MIAERWQTIVGGHLDDRVRITRADPQAMISDEILQMICKGHCHPGVTLTTVGNRTVGTGDVLTISAENGRWIYRLGEYDPSLRAWRMEWPD